MSWKLVKHVPITAVLNLKSGCRIGGSKDDIGIGDMDNPIIRHPLTKHPYIPGSSIKGKLRSLVEYSEGLVPSNGQPHGCDKDGCIVCRVFGPHKKSRHPHGPTRLIVRDSMLEAESERILTEAVAQGLNYAEVKSENWINRSTGTAGDPRTQERIPAGTSFNLTFSVRIFEEDDENKILDLLRKSLDLLQKDTLGGSGTRGYGWVELSDLKIGNAKV